MLKPPDFILPKEDPDQFEAFYRSVIPYIRDLGRVAGYAIAVHGSLRRDCDLIAVPWVDDAIPTEDFVLAIERMIGAYIRPTQEELDWYKSKNVVSYRERWSNKPNGRMSTCFYFNMSMAYIDLAVIPFIPK